MTDFTRRLRTFRTAAHRILVFVGVGLVALPCASWAAPGDLGVFDGVETLGSSLEMEAFVPATVFVVALEPVGGVRGYEFSIHLPPDATVLSVEANPPPLPSSFVLPNVYIGIAGCLQGDPNLRLLTLEFAFFGAPTAPVDALVCLEAASPSSEGLGGRPGYLQCDDELVAFGVAQGGGVHYPDGCLVVNPTWPQEGPVGVEERSFGAVKVGYSQR